MGSLSAPMVCLVVSNGLDFWLGHLCILTWLQSSVSLQWNLLSQAPPISTWSLFASSAKPNESHFDLAHHVFISTLLITCSFKSIVYSLSCFFPSLRVLHLQNQGETPKFNSLFIQAYWLSCLSNALSQNLTIFCDFNFNLVSLFILLWKLHALRILRTGIFFIRWNNKSIWYCVIYFTLLALSQLDSRCHDSWRIFLTFWR